MRDLTVALNLYPFEGERREALGNGMPPLVCQPIPPEEGSPMDLSQFNVIIVVW